MEIDEVREQIRNLDENILELAAKRIQLAEELGKMKEESGTPVSDYNQESVVLSRAREISKEKGLNPILGEDILHRLIEEAVVVQEEGRIKRDPFADGHSAVVIGGAGRMGQWMTRFLSQQGLFVMVHDPSSELVSDETIQLADWVFLATPPEVTASYYESWVDEPPQGIICDLCSIKTPLANGLEALLETGAKITSAHPMFGPDTRMLRDHDFVICPCGNEEADEELINLFGTTSARMILVPMTDHDEWMADALALAHASALTFAHSLPDEPQPLRSQTLNAMLEVAESVVNESPDVYFEIQAHNPHTLDALERLRTSVEQFETIIHNMDRGKFYSYMRKAAYRVKVHDE